MNDLMNYPARKRRKKPIVRSLVTIMTALLLMIGSGYIGARISEEHHNSVQSEVDVAQIYHPLETTTENNIELLNNITQLNDNLTLPELFEEANPAVVAISTEVIGRNAFGHRITRPASGSGFLVSPDGYIVTNDHVIEGASSITVLKHDGRQYPATIIGRDPNSDIAVIKIDGTDMPYLVFGDSDSLRVGEQVAAIGNPLGELANSMTVGHISALNRDINIDGVSHNKLQTDAAVNRGNSGGPLLNLYGEVIGVVSAKSVGMDVEGLGFAIPSSHAESVVSQLMQHGFVSGRAILGVQITVQDGTSNVQVASVNHGSAAERAGVMVGDVILSANGASVSSFADLRTVLDSLSPGDMVELRLQRGSEEVTLTAVLDEYRPSGL
jgi:serine protease Do